MEQILGQKMRPPVSFGKFLADYQQSLQNGVLPDAQSNAITAFNLHDHPDRFHSAEYSSSLFQLDQCDAEPTSKFVPGYTEMQRKIVTSVPPDATKLKTFQMLFKAKETTSRNPFKRSHEIYKLVKLPPPLEESDEKCDFFNDLIVTIRVYRPARATHIGQSLEKPVFAEEFECLGSNFLTELRDKISCVCNKKRFFDISENPAEEQREKDLDPGYFFITDTFYNDKRQPNNPDYSKTIRTWAKKAAGLKDLQFNVKKMEDTRFRDLTVSLGFPQLYQHHGNCEHVFTFAQVEVITPGAMCLWNRQYPRLRSFGMYNNRMCNMCGVQHYVFVVEQCNRQLHDPAYLCNKCFYSFHYIDGKKIGQFRAYRVNGYLDDDKNVNEEVENPTLEDTSQSETCENSALEENIRDLIDGDDEIEFITVKKETK